MEMFLETFPEMQSGKDISKTCSETRRCSTILKTKQKTACWSSVTENVCFKKKVKSAPVSF